MSSSSVTIPVRAMALESLEQFFPNLTAEQCAALRNGRPVPPSPDWTPPGGVDPQLAGFMYDTATLAAAAHAAVEGDPPGIACVLAVGEPSRLKLARKAVNQFVAQLYPKKKLIVVNATGKRVTTHPHPEIEEHEIVPGGSLGELRNVGLYNAPEAFPWVKPCWDDDDVYPPAYLHYMMGCVAKTATWVPTVLRRQLRIDINSSTAFVLDRPDGVPNTMIVPNVAGTKFDDASDPTVDDRFLANWADRRVVNNEGFPAAAASVAIHHGHNATPAEVFMAGAEPGVVALDPVTLTYLKHQLAKFGVNLVAHRGAQA
jgi:hypothetical protein